MTKGNVGPLLTDLQLVQWRSEISDLYAEAERMRANAAKREKRLKRYVARHFGMSSGKNKPRERDNE